ncbi:amino acid adenylation domain-containing protein [Nonomuraea sp. NPDC050643]|uniref:non-ribosomal peptide synthetase n=1 Tax=Nonomuraea sp. NPDC050643 TaxID=3155660 RepID=UPI0033D551AE
MGLRQSWWPDGLAARVRRWARGHDVDVKTVLLAVHLKVLSTITREPEVITGYRADASVRTYRLPIPDGTWHDLVGLAARERQEDGPGGGGPYESLLDLSGMDGGRPAEPADEIPLQVCFSGRGERVLMRLRHRLDVLDGDYAERLAGYYITALRLLVADAGQDHDGQSLLSEHEVRFQLYGLAGRTEPAPARLFVEAFEERVRLAPRRLAVAHHDRRWSYEELDRRANQVAHALLDHGAHAEDVVAVAMERTPEWVAALLGVLKAGCVYLPIRPDFPAERVAKQLARSECRLVVSQEGSPHGAARGRASIELDKVFAAPYSTAAPGIVLKPAQLAYIYFTSGSTGEPKGAMCEHAGLINHLHAKIEDMELGEGDVVAQTASQCFDISLWQLAAPLLAGGSVRIVDTDDQLDVSRFLAETADVHVLQVVPSYLDVLLSGEHRDLGAVRSVSVTGEALKLELVRRWFARYPRIRLVNAYGATEVSDDTMHAVLDGPPARDFVSVGRPLRNVCVSILDDRLRLVPLGSPGEIAFSGVSVGRGYINDAERTKHAFVADPYRPGTRMYRTGDFGRWLPEGTIEFLGRLDEQVKVRGFRIEIGEIENRLLTIAGVRGAAVVVDETSRLVAFYGAPESVRPQTLRDALAASLPDYMVPTYFHRLDALPMSENGKVDKKPLRLLAATIGHAGGAYIAPATGTEHRIATAWAEVLNVPLERIGRDDDFFELGGTSLAAVRLVVRLDRQISLKQLSRSPRLRDLAASMTRGSRDELLQPLSTGAREPVATLVCFPYAGGNAVNFQRLARELQPRGIAVYAAELPGHDFGSPLAGVGDVARRVHDEIMKLPIMPVLLWGHGAGAAPAVETARLLEESGREVARVFAGACPLGPVERLEAEIAQVSGLAERELIERLREQGAYVELDGLKPERLALVGAAYRHDVRAAGRYLIEAQRDPGAHRLAAALDVVVSADDPQPVDRWSLLSPEVTVHELAEGGPYFIRTRAADAAAIVLTAVPAWG